VVQSESSKWAKCMIYLPRVVYFLALANNRLYWDKKRLKRYQEKRLRRVVRYAYDFVPFYHKRFREAGVDPNQIRTVEDLSKLPIVKKDEFKKQNPQQIVSKEFELNKLKKVTTSGSTGTPFVIYITIAEDAWRKAIYMRSNINCGQKPRDRWLVMTSPRHFHDTTGIQRRLGIFSQTCISLFESTEQKLSQIEALNPHILDGYSGSLFLLAKEVKRRGLKTIKPKLMFGSAEFIDLPSRRYMENVFDAPFCDQFGAAEVDRSAWQCLERQGYHMDVDSVITEFVDKNGEAVGDGERGEVVFTSLFNFAMPFIRYAIGDVGAPSDDSCPCGCTLPLMKVIEGRKDSFLMLPGNRVVSPMVFNFAVSTFKYYEDIDQYRIRQRKTDLFEVFLKMNKYPLSGENLASEFEAHVKKFLNIEENELRFEVSFVDEIPLSPTGKLHSVFSDVKVAAME
jgi:phenylacetate-CoA ligase